MKLWGNIFLPNRFPTKANIDASSTYPHRSYNQKFVSVLIYVKNHNLINLFRSTGKIFDTCWSFISDHYITCYDVFILKLSTFFEGSKPLSDAETAVEGCIFWAITLFHSIFDAFMMWYSLIFQIILFSTRIESIVQKSGVFKYFLSWLMCYNLSVFLSRVTSLIHSIPCSHQISIISLRFFSFFWYLPQFLYNDFSCHNMIAIYLYCVCNILISIKIQLDLQPSWQIVCHLIAYLCDSVISSLVV